MQSRLALEEPAADRAQPSQLALEAPQAKADEIVEPAAAAPVQTSAGKRSVEDSTAAMLAAMGAKNKPEKKETQTKAKGKAKAKSKAQAKGSPVQKKIHKEKKHKTQPTISWERTRMQIMCRTGSGGAGSSHAIKFTKGKKAEAEAWAKAEKWLQQERKNHGF